MGKQLIKLDLKVLTAANSGDSVRYNRSGNCSNYYVWFNTGATTREDFFFSLAGSGDIIKF